MNKIVNITCIIPLYNAVNYIESTLESLLNQKYSLEEIIVVDDKSTDESVSVVKKMMEKYPSIKLIEQTNNLGVSAARNLGISVAKNDWILMMDADDIAHPDLLLKEVELLKENVNSSPAPICVHPAYIQIDNLGNIIEKSEFRGGQYSFDDLFGTLLVRNHIITSSGLLMNKNVAHEIGGYRAEISISEDVELYLRLAKKGLFLYVDEPLIYYRRHIKNATSDYKKVNQASRSLLDIYSIEEIKEGILKRNKPLNQNILDFVTVLYQNSQFEEGFKYLEGLNEESILEQKLFFSSIYYLENENWTEMEILLERLIKIADNNGAAINNLGVLKAFKGEYKEAEYLLNKALRLFPGYMDATLNLQNLKGNHADFQFTKRELRKNLLRYN